MYEVKLSLIAAVLKCLSHPWKASEARAKEPSILGPLQRRQRSTSAFIDFGRATVDNIREV